MTYKPCFTDPRVLRRIKSSLDWVSTYVSNKHHWLSSREIQRKFGSLSRPLGQYLKTKLLICTNTYYSNITHVCQQYKLNQEGYLDLCKQIGYDPKIQISVAQQLELDTGEFQYKQQSYREYHPLQNLPKRIKRPLLSSKGFRHEYDIRCAAQTLILQHARSLGFNRPTPALDRYIQDRTAVRSEISDQLGIDKLTVKRIMTALLNGASISTWHENMIFSYVNYNTMMISQLRENSYIKQYHKEIKLMWRSVRSHRDMRPGERFNAKMKSEIYRICEDSVRSVIKRYLRKTKNQAFIEHDGWSCHKPVDIERLQYEVKRQTGFVIELDWTIHEYIGATNTHTSHSSIIV